MYILHRFTANDPPSLTRARELRLLNTRVDGLQGLEKGDELRRKSFQRRDLAREERIATCLRLREQEECRQARRL